IKVYNVTAPLNIKENDLPKQMTWFNLGDREQYTFPVPMDKIYKFIEG
ncbi:A/G-specific adenine glycosylase, partial [Xylophilus sp. Kf1]|nr:A/G-specific adenine glycosylase [Xylophilus sp. Kf1]